MPMATFDLVIRGGTVADGLGSELRQLDIGVINGKIAEVSANLASGREEIDARGWLVTPGFVDIHTHYDGQATWDNRMEPSSYHGVTTAVMGNCGVGFAPVRPADKDRLIELMEGVEDLPEPVLQAGISWGWESFPDFLNVLAGRSYDMDLLAFVPHAPLRLYVMGERACRLEPATESDIAQMRGLLVEAMRAGAAGFSTSRSLTHQSRKGDPIPCMKASREELVGIALGMKQVGAGVFEVVSQFKPDIREAEFAMLRKVVAEIERPFTFGLVQDPRYPDDWRRLLELASDAAAEGLEVSAQVAPRPVGSVVTLQATTCPLQDSWTFRNIAAQPADALVNAMRESELRSRIIGELELRAGEDGYPRYGRFERLFVQGDVMDYAPSRSASVATIAQSRGQTPVAYIYDLFVETGGKAVLFHAALNYVDFDLSVIREMIAHPVAIPGLGDGGAHVGFISDASFPTFALSYWGRDRKSDGFDLPWLVKRQTSVTAKLMGLNDRGVITPGMKADINVIDFDRLNVETPDLRSDLPAGGTRLVQRAQGYVATIVSGEIVSRDGVATGPLPGKLVRTKCRDLRLRD
jgi:N-acyl-D-aspartate/D-glutamate deacylase